MPEEDVLFAQGCNVSDATESKLKLIQGCNASGATESEPKGPKLISHSKPLSSEKPKNGLAIVFPYFNQVLGVLGAVNFWPWAVYFPVVMYFVQRKIGAWTRKWVVLQTFSVVCLLVSLLALIGSVEGLISAKLS